MHEALVEQGITAMAAVPMQNAVLRRCIDVHDDP
jgi:hypothetical protein